MLLTVLVASALWLYFNQPIVSPNVDGRFEWWKDGCTQLPTVVGIRGYADQVIVELGLMDDGSFVAEGKRWTSGELQPFLSRKMEALPAGKRLFVRVHAGPSVDLIKGTQAIEAVVGERNINFVSVADHDSS